MRQTDREHFVPWSFAPFLVLVFLLCLCFPVTVCCVWSEKKESDVSMWESRVKQVS